MGLGVSEKVKSNHLQLQESNQQEDQWSLTLLGQIASPLAKERNNLPLLLNRQIDLKRSPQLLPSLQLLTNLKSLSHPAHLRTLIGLQHQIQDGTHKTPRIGEMMQSSQIQGQRETNQRSTTDKAGSIPTKRGRLPWSMLKLSTKTFKRKNKKLKICLETTIKVSQCDSQTSIFRGWIIKILKVKFIIRTPTTVPLKPSLCSNKNTKALRECTP